MPTIKTGKPHNRRTSDASNWLSRLLNLPVNARRYSDNNYHWLCFTYCPRGNSSYSPTGLTLRSANEYPVQGGPYNYDGCHLMIQVRGHTLIVELPEILKPQAVKTYATFWDEATIARLGRNWYTEYTPKEYGFTFLDTDLHVHYGVQTDCSSTDKTKLFSYPWTRMRVVRETFYNDNGMIVAEVKPAKGKYHIDFKLREEAKAKVRPVCFDVQDEDGTVVKVSTHVEETVYMYGVGYFQWLSLLRKPMVRRDLYMSFNQEVGREKGSWKGGLMGTSISTFAGESHGDALKRFIAKSKDPEDSRHRLNLTYLGRSEETPCKPV